MKNKLAAATLALGLLMVPIAAFAGDSSVILTVHHADCVLCGPIVKGTLTRITGVKSVEVSQADAMADVTAIVKFDDAVTRPEAMIKATAEQGYATEVKS